ncbi:MAG: hypothetical protein HYV09_40940 [Deltaproteobacteria bacterium]|nr:hypothetical protein [Deltaproteobacteria bacterium]
MSLVAVLLLAASASAQPAPRQWTEHLGTVRVGARAEVAALRYGIFGPSLDLGYRARPWFLLGVGAGARDRITGSDCYGDRCNERWLALDGWVEVHTFPRSVVVPWVRASIGNYQANPYFGTDIGLELRLGILGFGGWAGGRAVLDREPIGYSAGLRLSVELGNADD